MNVVPFRLLLLTSLICLGCGGTQSVPRAAVRGEVTWNGEPVETGVVLFVPEANTPDSATSPVPAKIAQGRFELTEEEGPPVGTHRIEIRASRKTGKRTPEPTPAMKRFDPTLTSVEIVQQYLPPRFNDNSTLSKVVEPGENVFQFDLTAK
ncbi:hypothetical protein GC163_16100 [bacterium]|nr:hypothetical protein [bacterium]